MWISQVQLNMRLTPQDVDLHISACSFPKSICKIHDSSSVSSFSRKAAIIHSEN